MKCFLYFKEKCKSKREGSQSAPELRNRSNPVLDRTTKSSSSVPSPKSIPELYREKEQNLRVFSLQELREATNGFNRLLKLGEGGFGSVYKGTIRPADGERGSPILVAIKKLNPQSLQEKCKSKREGSQSAPELRNRSNPVLDRTTKSSSSVPSPKSIPELYREKEQNLRVFSLQELREATNGFNRLLKLGEGGFGSVYKGTIRPADGERGSPILVAIKKLNPQSLQGHKEWLAEVQFLGVVEHPNLVKLLGYCSVDGERRIQRLLVYEFVPNRSLEDHLFNRALPTLPWITRLQIMLGAAQGLAYLHMGLEVQVIFRDFKSSNVLLDEEFRPKLSDFGLAREGPTDDRSHVSTSVVGTYGYAAPEYIETGHLSTSSDLWSFGVVLYEILTGRRVLDKNRPTAEQKLLYWVRQFPADSKRFSMIIDPLLRDQYSLTAARNVSKLADSCLNKNAKERPTMSQVVEVLEQALQDSQGSTSSSKTSSEASTSKSAKRRPK